ncbi:MAG: hypothetical protein AAF705_08185, partial [Bacteroidota bacterium]
MSKINLISLLIFSASLVVFTSCDDDPCEDIALPPGFTCDDGNITCDRTCATGEVLSVDCQCITDASQITPDPCAGTAACPEGFVKEAQTCDCVEIMPTTVIDLNAGFLASSLDAFGTVEIGGFTIPAFYDIDGVFSPGAYNGQIRRVAQLKEIVGVTRDEPITFDIAEALRN